MSKRKSIAACLLAGLAALSIARAEYREQPVVVNEKAPELDGKNPSDWLNASDRPITLKARKGKVTVIHFWTFGCINCRRNLPIYERWHKRFSEQDVAIIGIHTPEFEQEKVASNVAKRSKELGVTYPVLLDPKMNNWRRWNQQFWPAVYLIDRHGKIRYRWEGEMNYGNLDGERKMTALIEDLIKDN